MRRELFGAVLLAIAGCAGPGDPGDTLFVPSRLLYFGPRASAQVHLDCPQAMRTTATIPANASKVRLIVKDRAGHIVGGLAYRDIPSDNRLDLDGLPARTELRFDATLADQSLTEVGRSKKKVQLTEGPSNPVSVPVYMNAGQLSGTNTSASAQTSNSNRVSTRLTFATDDFFLVRPVLSAIDVNGNPVACSPAYTIRSGYETEDEAVLDTVSTSSFIMRAQAGTFNAEVDFTPNCPASAALITRKLEFEKVATLSVRIN